MKKNTTWNIRRLVDKTIVPWTQRPSVLYWRLLDFNFDPPNQKLHNPNKYLVHIMFITQVHKWLAWWKLWVRYRSRPSWHGREWSFYSRNWWRRQSQVIKSLIKIYVFKIFQSSDYCNKLFFSNLKFQSLCWGWPHIQFCTPAGRPGPPASYDSHALCGHAATAPSASATTRICFEAAEVVFKCYSPVSYYYLFLFQIHTFLLGFQKFTI